MACDIVMTLGIKRVHYLPPHLRYVSTPSDITQKNENILFLSIV